MSNLRLLLSSEGGDLIAGFTAYNFLRSLPIPVETINMGSVESIAVVLYLAGEKRTALSGTKFLIHNFFGSFPSSQVDYLRLAERSSSLTFDLERYVQIFQDRTQGCEVPIDVRKHLDSGALVISAEEATSVGIVHNVVPSAGLIDRCDIHWYPPILL